MGTILDEAGLDAGGAALDPAPGGMGEELRAQADAEQGGGLARRPRTIRARVRGSQGARSSSQAAGDPPRTTSPATPCRSCGQLLAEVGAAHVDVRGGLEVRAQPAQAGAVLVLDDEQARLLAHSSGR